MAPWLSQVQGGAVGSPAALSIPVIDLVEVKTRNIIATATQGGRGERVATRWEIKGFFLLAVPEARVSME